MATTKITDLTAYTDPVNTDVLPIVDVTSDVTKKVSVANVMKNASLGTAAAPGISFDGDPNTGIYSPGADQVAISTGGSGRLFIDASGRVGMGAAEGTYAASITTTGNNGFLVKTGTASAVQIYAGNTGGEAALGTLTSDPLNFITAGSSRIRITSAGLVGVGTSAPGAGLHIATAGQTTSALDTSGSLNLLVSDTGASAGNGGSIVFGFNSGSGRFASIKGQVITGAGNSTGHLTFSTRNATSDATLTERLRITNDGLVGIGTSTPGTALDVNGAIRSNDIFTLYKNSTDAFYIGAGTIITGGTSTDVALRSNQNGSILFSTNGATERMRIDSSGRVGIGTTPDSKLHVVDAIGNAIRIGFDSGVTNKNIYDAGQHIFRDTSGNNSLVIDSSKRLLVGTSTTLAGATDSLLQIRGNSSGTQFAGKVALATDVAAASIVSGTDLGAIYFGNVANGIGGLIECKGDAQWGTNDYPGRLVFSTTADGASSPTERMRISNNGAFLLTSNTVTIAPSSGTGDFYVQGVNAAGSNARIFLTCPGSNEASIWYERSTSRLYIYSQSGGVYLGSTATSWTANSDERLKDIIEPIENAANKVSSLRAVIGKYKTDEEGTRRSFLIAQDVQAVLPEAVDASNPDSLGVSYTDVIPLLVAAIKEQQAMIADLQDKVAALESA